MLADAQIERYARQIVLPEIGGRGQERLLGSRVGLIGGGSRGAACDTAILCALHLAVSGVGTLALEEGLADEATEAIAARNPETKIAERASELDAKIAIGDAMTLSAHAPTVFGGSGAAGVIIASCRERCPACVLAASPPLDAPLAWSDLVPSLLAPLLATVALRELLGLAEPRAPFVLVVGIERATSTMTPLSSRAGCTDCARARMDASSGIR